MLICTLLTLKSDTVHQSSLSPGSHFCGCFPATSLCNSFEDRTTVDGIYGWPIFKWVAMTWSSGHQLINGCQGDICSYVHSMGFHGLISFHLLIVRADKTMTPKLWMGSINGICNPSGLFWEYYPGALFLSLVMPTNWRWCNRTFHLCPIFKWVVENWSRDGVSG